MSGQRIFHAAPAILSASLIPAQFVVVNVDGIDKIVPLPRALNFLNNKNVERYEELLEIIQTLQEKVDSLHFDTDSVYKVKGDVMNFNYLPSNPKIGDCYNVLHSFTIDDSSYPAGTNVVWDGTKWDTMGGQIEIDATFKQKIIDMLTPSLTSIAEEAVIDNLTWDIQ